MNNHFWLILFCLIGSCHLSSQSVIISESNLTTSEGGSAVMYTVVLTSAPDMGETVTVTPASTDVTEATVSGAVTFNSGDWNTPKSITLTPGAFGDGNDGDVMFTISHTVMSTGGAYMGVMAADISGTNQNIDGNRTIVIDPSSAIVLMEGSGSVIVTIKVGLHNNPTADVTVNLTNTAMADVSMSVSSVTLTAGNGYMATVTLTGDMDAFVEGTESFSITTEPSSSTDNLFNNINPFDITGKVIDQTCPDLSTLTPIVFSITESSCNTIMGNPMGGEIDTSMNMCPASSTLMFSVDDGTFSSALPVYNQITAQKIEAACFCSLDGAITSDTVEVTTAPNTTCPAAFTASSANSIIFGDPCNCSDPLNCEQGGIYYFHDTLTITSGVGGLKIGISTATDFLVGSCGSLILANSTNTDSIPETAVGSGIYKLEFWRPENVVPVVSVVESGLITAIPITTFSPACSQLNCASAIPTLGQWGLIILAMSLLIVGLVAFKNSLQLSEKHTQ